MDISYNSMECIICFDISEPLILECKHSICCKCYHKINSCPLCRKEIRKVSLQHVQNVQHVQIYVQEENYDRPFLTKEVCSIIMCTTCMIIIVWLSLMM